jgi:thioredoxin reductase
MKMIGAMKPDYDVIIIGAGPAGIFVSITLTEMGRKLTREIGDQAGISFADGVGQVLTVMEN